MNPICSSPLKQHAIASPDPPLSDGTITLRSWRTEDAPAFIAKARDAGILRWTPLHENYGEEDFKEWLADEPRRRTEGIAIAFAVEDERSQLVGNVGLSRLIWRDKRGEVFYWTAADARGKGIATRALGLLSRWAFEELGIERLELLTVPENVASQRVAMRVGYKREGFLRSVRETTGGRVDLVLFSLLPSDLGLA